MTGHLNQRRSDRSSEPGSDPFVVETSPDAIARRAEHLSITIPPEASDGVRSQLDALCAHAKVAGLSLTPGGSL